MDHIVGVCNLAAEESKHDAVVVGAGPSGSSAAIQLANSGLSVLMIDTRKEVGSPVHCGEAVSDRVFSICDLSPNGPWIASRFDLLKIFSPSGGHIGIRSKGYNLYRDVFDRALAHRAVENGAILSLDERVISVDRSNSGWTVRTDKGLRNARGLVNAAGCSSILAQGLGIGMANSSMYALGAKLPIKDYTKEIWFYTRAELEGGYEYFFPRGEEANVGVCARKNVKTHFESLLSRLDIDKVPMGSLQGGIIPDGGLLSPLVGDGVISVGDAGGFCNPVSKAGIIGALLSGKAGGKAMVDLLSGNMEALWTFEKEMIEHPAFDSRYLVIRDLLSELNDKDQDSLARISDGKDPRDIGRRALIKRSLSEPRLLRLAKNIMPLMGAGDYLFDWVY